MRIHLPAVVVCLIFLVYVEPEIYAQEKKSPNVIFVLSDDLGYGELGCYGQEHIKTLRIDQMAKEGMRFTQYYAGATVCAPSRCTLMTGLHNGHSYVRGNGDAAAQSLRDSDVTIAEVMKSKGYHTALVGKWGLGEPPDGESGYPWKQGFDRFYGYLNQAHAHNYYPRTLWDQDKRITLKNKMKISKTGPWGETGYATQKNEYSHDLFMSEATKFIKDKAKEPAPFFLYLSVTIPHANNEGAKETGNGQEVPDYGIYKDKDWPDQNKGQAAMISYLDKGLGEILDLLKELQIDEQTLLIFTSDNGPHKEGGNNPQFFKPSGPLRGMKRDLYEGGIRVPMIVRWPGKIPPGKVSHHVCYAGDFFATFCELTGADTPPGLDSVSILPELQGISDKQTKHDFLYWEFYEQGSRQAVRQGDWKCIRQPMKTGKVELYNLASDLLEEKDISADNPEIVKKMVAIMDEAHVDNPNWKVPPTRRNK